MQDLTNMTSDELYSILKAATDEKSKLYHQIEVAKKVIIKVESNLEVQNAFISAIEAKIESIQNG